MKAFLLFILSFSLYCNSQTLLQGSIKDVKTKTPLPYCSVGLKNSTQGTIANEEGTFRISVDPARDTLTFSYLGYKTKSVPAALLAENNTVFLESKDNLLNEVVVSANNDYLYSIIEECRKKMLEAPVHLSKVYLEAETDKEENPVNMLECYYNGFTRSGSIENLFLKTGRAGLAPTKENGYFISDDVSKLISYLSLTNSFDYLPFVPFQLGKSKLKKRYALKIMESDPDVSHIAFTPKINDGQYFEGEVWVDKKDNSILKINLSVRNSTRQPFVPYKGGSINNFSMKITESFLKNGNNSLLNFIKFQYTQEYKNNRPNGRLNNGSDSVSRLNTESIMYFYDYEKPFHLPFFNYYAGLSDYRKITFLPYNETFWKNSSGLMLTDSQNKKLVFFKKNGFLFNYDKKFQQRIFDDGHLKMRGLYENNYILWSDTGRISLKKNLHYENNASGKNDQQDFRANLVKLKAQLFMDINPSGDSVQHFSVSVFDVYETFYRLPEEPYSDCFINIYFDIYEIERRKMEKKIQLFPDDPGKIDSLYKETMKDIDTQTQLYLKEVQSGKNITKLIKWNNYILENLNIDNIRIFNPEGKK